MNWFKKLFSPLTAFIGIQLVWVLLVIFWVYWFIGSHKEFRDLAVRYKPELVGQSVNWLVLVEGLFLLFVILVGVYVIFLYWKRQSTLYKEQKNFISQVTHELKSPLASIQLHLETIRLRKPPAEKLERFLDTMLSDTERLNGLINNLLMAGKLEHRRRGAHYTAIDFSDFIVKFMERKRSKLPEGGNLALEVEKGIRAAVDVEGMEMVLRNLFENAVLYAEGSPDIRVCLKAAGKKCLLTFQDKGMGVDVKDLKKIFRMFYRVRRPGENIRGTGLGLYIVKSVIKEHGGRITVTSEGAGKGCTFLITLPLKTGDRGPEKG
ncbi:MAG: integral membrane sensor signal transduction histidine [Geobacteraceae bacterium]|nr:MAG: integral membrane sensor signal transduction histidine [Geobacteraceae bacterium]